MLICLLPPTFSLTHSFFSLLPLSLFPAHISIMSDLDGVTLCNICEQFRDLDRILAWDPLNHHESWTALCRSAKEGCELCKAFVRGQTQKHGPPKDEFDRDKDFPTTQITWRPNTAGGPYTLQQDALFRPPRWEAVCVWVDVYTRQGTFTSIQH